MRESEMRAGACSPPSQEVVPRWRRLGEGGRAVERSGAVSRAPAPARLARVVRDGSLPLRDLIRVREKLERAFAAAVPVGVAR